MEKRNKMEILEYIKSIEDKDFSDENGACKLDNGIAVPEIEIANSEKQNGIILPEDYKQFIKKYGNADFFGAKILHPSELYQLDEETIEMEGFIPFAQDVLGNYFAFDNDMNIVKCSHDPLGYGKISKTFTEWTNLHFDFIEKIAKGEEDWEHQYIKADKEIEKSWKRMKAVIKARSPKKWWEIWK